MATPVLAQPNQSLWVQLEKKFELLGKATQFLLLVGGVFLFFGIHNLLQETMMSIKGFQFGIMLGYMEVLG
jgi:solute carrier family 35 (adenosine 3'-phospho 5'-phosphosulfate transporter), member B3